MIPVAVALKRPQSKAKNISVFVYLLWKMYPRKQQQQIPQYKFTYAENDPQLQSQTETSRRIDQRQIYNAVLLFEYTYYFWNFTNILKINWVLLKWCQFFVTIIKTNLFVEWAGIWNCTTRSVFENRLSRIKKEKRYFWR